MKDVDLAKNTITVRREGQKEDEVLDLAKVVSVHVIGKSGKLTYLKAGMLVNLTLSKDKKAVVGISEIKPKNGNLKNGK